MDDMENGIAARPEEGAGAQTVQGTSGAVLSAAPGAAVAVPAPAVGTAIRILDYLAKHKPRAGVSEIARELGLNKSSCFNVLSTLVHFGVLAKIPGAAQYQLGPRLVELAGAARRQYSHRALVRRHFEDLVNESGVVGVIGQPLGDEASFVIIDQLAPPGLKSRNPAPPVGSVIPLTGPSLGRALLSVMDEEDALDVVRHCEPGLDGAGEQAWRQQLRDAKARGWAESLEQYQSGICAVAAPIGQAGEPYLVVGLVGHAADLPAARIAALGPRLAERARALSGQLPVSLS